MFYTGYASRGSLPRTPRVCSLHSVHAPWRLLLTQNSKHSCLVIANILARGAAAANETLIKSRDARTAQYSASAMLSGGCAAVDTLRRISYSACVVTLGSNAVPVVPVAVACPVVSPRLDGRLQHAPAARGRRRRRGGRWRRRRRDVGAADAAIAEGQRGGAHLAPRQPARQHLHGRGGTRAGSRCTNGGAGGARCRSGRSCRRQ